MKVVAFNGSSRKNGNTAILMNTVLEELAREGIESEFVQLAGESLQGCIACRECFEKKDKRCAVKKDNLNRYMEKMLEAQGILLGSPVYFSDVSANMKALMERCGYVSIANGGLLKRKVGAGVVAVRRAGAVHTFDTLNHWFLIAQMIVPGSRYWNLGIGRNPGEVKEDQEGLEIMKTLGQNMAWLMKKIWTNSESDH